MTTDPLHSPQSTDQQKMTTDLFHNRHSHLVTRLGYKMTTHPLPHSTVDSLTLDNNRPIAQLTHPHLMTEDPLHSRKPTQDDNRPTPLSTDPHKMTADPLHSRQTHTRS